MWTTVAIVRRHWMFWLLLAGGLILRGIAQIAYEPALLFIDSKKYIFGLDFTNTIWGSFDPLGYSLLMLRPVLMLGRSLPSCSGCWPGSPGSSPTGGAAIPARRWPAC